MGCHSSWSGESRSRRQRSVRSPISRVILLANVHAGNSMSTTSALVDQSFSRRLFQPALATHSFSAFVSLLVAPSIQLWPGPKASPSRSVRTESSSAITRRYLVMSQACIMQVAPFHKRSPSYNSQQRATTAVQKSTYSSMTLHFTFTHPAAAGLGQRQHDLLQRLSPQSRAHTLPQSRPQ